MFLPTLFRRSGRTPVRPEQSRRLALEPLEDRIALNSRFVVPFEQTADDTSTFHTLSRALTKAGLVSGDVVQIEPNSSPGAISDANLPAVTNLTIRGHLGFAARDLPPLTGTDALSVDAAQAGLRLENLNLILSGGGLTFNANGSLLASSVNYVGPVGIDAIALNASAVAVRNNTIFRSTLGIGGSADLIQVTTSANSQNVIAGNTLQVFSAVPILHYLGGNTITDRVEDNVFVGNELAGGAEASTTMLFIEALGGLTVRRNVFRDGTSIFSPVAINLGVQNLQILDNTFDFPAAFASDIILQVGANATAGLATSVLLARNQFRGPARAMSIRHAASGTLSARVEGNSFAGNSIGVTITSTGGSLANIDLGGGNQGSAGGNNFRTFEAAASSSGGAIVVDNATGAFGAIQAQNNLFGTANAETAVFDNGDDGTAANVVTTGALSGNAAFVQALFVKFLGRVGNLANANDAGGWVNQLNGNTPISAVANGIVRSAEALGFVVDGLYKGILGREADAGGRAFHVGLLAGGTTVEQLQASFFAGAEYRLRFAGDAAFVASLYQRLLGRTPTQPEIDSWLVLLPGMGRQGVAAGFLGSTEFRNREVTKLYFDLLRRATPPGPAEIAANVNTGLDLLSLRVAFAGSAEFFLRG